MRYDIGIGGWEVSNRLGDVLKTYSLGSCLGVAVIDVKNPVAGMIHIALPDSKMDREKAKRMPGYFADTGLPVLFNALEKKGGNRRQFVIKVAGGASMMDSSLQFDIGRRNIMAVKRILWKMGYGVKKDDVGGNIARTMAITVNQEIVELSNAKRKWSI